MVFTHAAYAGDVRIRGLERAHRVTRGRVSQVCTLFIHNSGAAVTSSQQAVHTSPRSLSILEKLCKYLSDNAQ